MLLGWRRCICLKVFLLLRVSFFEPFYPLNAVAVLGVEDLAIKYLRSQQVAPLAGPLIMEKITSQQNKINISLIGNLKAFLKCME